MVLESVLYPDTGIDLTLAGVRAVKVRDMGELGASGVRGIGGGGGIARAGGLAMSRGFAALWSAAFLVAERRPAGNEDLGLDTTCVTLPDVEGLLPSSDGRGLGPSFTFGLEYCA
jgi:hypothetical protein